MTIKASLNGGAQDVGPQLNVGGRIGAWVSNKVREKLGDKDRLSMDWSARHTSRSDK